MSDRGHLIDRRGLDFEVDDTAILLKLEAPGNYSAEIVLRLAPDELARFRDGECLPSTDEFLKVYMLPAIARLHLLLNGPNAPR